MTRLALGAALAAVCLAAGCGSSQLSANQLRTQATTFCSTASRETARIPAPASPEHGVEFLRRGISVLTPELAGLRKLKAPSDLAQVYSTSITSFEQKLKDMKVTVRELDSGTNPVTAMTALAQRLAPIESAEDGAWSALQVPACLNR